MVECNMMKPKKKVKVELLEMVKQKKKTSTVSGTWTAAEGVKMR